MAKGKLYMKILRIDNRKAEYSLDGTIYKNISDIDKDDILKLLNNIMKNEISLDSEIDNISNEAEKIIYIKLKNKLDIFISNKDRTKAKFDTLFADVIAKYNLGDDIL